ncbi:MAG TPA: zf-HC2 domain-containing protein [Bryobacteraceae bacterium]|jgi:hypothetical protein|nr:zf-HC2 domain-containing protein [Bryobacteraceae bacterium]
MEELNCKTVRRSLWDYVGGALDASERREIGWHLEACRECELHQAEVRSLRSGLRHLPVRHVPPMVNTRLRVLASRERSRQLARQDFASWMAEQKSRAKLFFDNLLKPFAVPAAGGVLASFLCFGVIVDNLHVIQDLRNDLPVGISTDVAIDELTPFSFRGQDLMVQLTVDSTGHVTDFELPQTANPTPAELQEIGNLVLYSTFTPAFRFGRPVASKRYFYIGHISVKG